MKAQNLFLIFLLGVLAPWTANAQQSLPYRYGFENVSLANEGWTMINFSSDYNTPRIERASSLNYVEQCEGSYCFNFSSYDHTPASNDQYLISKELDAPEGGVVQFYYQVYWGSDPERFKVGYSTTDADLSSFTFGDEVATTSDQWTLFEQAFPAGTKYVAVFYYSRNYYLFVDDFKFFTCYQPEDFTINALTSTSASFSWTAVGDATEWLFQYGPNADFSDATSVTISGTPSCEITGLSEDSSYYARVRSQSGDAFSFWTDPCHFMPTDKFVIGVGPTNTDFNLPTYTNGYSALTEQIYTTTELGAQPGIIESIDFYNTSDSVQRLLDIFIVNTDKSTFNDGSDWIIVSNSDRVFRDTLTFASNAWTTINLEKSFTYEASHNIAIIVHDHTNQYNSPKTYFRVFPATGQALCVHANSYTNLDPTWGRLPNGTVASCKNQIRLSMTELCYVPDNLTVNYTDGNTAEVSWNSIASAWNIDVNGMVTEITENPYTLTDLALDTHYEVKVQAVCSQTLSDWTDAVSFTTDACMPEDMCAINYELTDSYGDGWSYNHLDVVDASTQETIATLRVKMGRFESGRLEFCEGRTLNFVWVNGDEYSYECGFVFTNTDGDVIYSHHGGNPSNIPVPGLFFSYTMECAPVSCLKPTNLEVNVDDLQATATWESEASAWQICLNNDETNLIEVDVPTYTFNNLEYATTYSVKVRSNCSPEFSHWIYSENFQTDFCSSEDRCEIGYELSGGYYDDWWDEWYGWDDSQILVVDHETGNLIASLTLTYYDSQSGITGTLPLCEGRTYDLVWNKGNGWYSFDEYCAFTIYDPSGNVMVSHDSGTALAEGLLTSFVMDCSCVIPTSLTATSVSSTSATLSWESDQTKFDLRYQPDYTYHFDEGLDAWTTIDADGDGFNWLWSRDILSVQGDQKSHYLFSQSYDNNSNKAIDPDNYLVSPKVQLGGSISFYARSQDDWYIEHFGVAVSTTGNTNASDFTTIQEWDAEDSNGQSGWKRYTVDLSAYSGEGYVAIRHFNSRNRFYLDIDEITILEPGQNEDDWTIVENITETTYTLNALPEGGTFRAQVRGYCEENLPTAWNILTKFRTLPGQVFATAGNWNEASNWQSGEVPEAGSDVVIAADVVVPADYVAVAGNVIFQNSATLTIADGGQFKTTYGGINVTMQKHFTGADFSGASNAGYYFIANPVRSIQRPAYIGLTANEYDLYSFDSREEGSEWQNFKEHHFPLRNNKGYLYSNSDDLDIGFTGKANATSLNKMVELEYYDDFALGGFHMIGNPFTCNAYLTVSRPFYVMNEDGSEIIASTNDLIPPMTGLFVRIFANRTINFTSTEPTTSFEHRGSIIINVRNDGSGNAGNRFIDRAVLRFGENEGLEKFQLNPSHTKLYIPKDDKDYAIAYAEKNGEIPLNFKAEHDGSYTLNFNSEALHLNYLHLIDNFTGTDVDLLINSSYNFQAHATDNDSRFRLVFNVTGVKEETFTSNFAYFSNGNIVILDDEAGATLQVIDILGRIVYSGEGVQTVSTSGIPAGVYVLRMMNGNDVKTQKIVVR